MRRLFGAISLFLTLSSVPAMAQDRPLVVLELFTSQGCSSCPPADRLLRDIDRDNDDVLALSFHVDYWDYIGWTDTFADPSNGDRQKTYARRFQERMVYTPQMIVQGQKGVVGHQDRKIATLIDRVRSQGPAAQVSLSRADGMLTIGIASVDGPVGEAELHMIRFSPSGTVNIRRGENSGRQLSYTNIVRSWSVIDLWNGESPGRVTVPMTGELPVAILVQGRHQGDVLGAAALR